MNDLVNASSVRQVRQHGRQALANIIWVSILNFVFLLVAFQTAPNAAPIIATGWMLVRAMFYGLDVRLSAFMVAQDAVRDVADRQTRHAIALAQQYTVRDQAIDDLTFWPEVKRRLKQEADDLFEPTPPKLSWWRSAGLVVGNITGRLVGDLILIGITSALASPGY